MPRRKSEPQIIPTEHDEAVCLAEYCRTRGFRFSHIPQETFTRNWGTKMRNKQEGVNRGVPDYIVIVRGRVVFIELKRIKKSTVSPEQVEWIDALNQCPGVSAFIAYGWNDAVDKICAVELQQLRGVDKTTKTP